jgi:hypothetical protein
MEPVLENLDPIRLAFVLFISPPPSSIALTWICRRYGFHPRLNGTAVISAPLPSPPWVSPSQDAIFEILSWLPAKSLRRFRCVSKEWRALVCSQSFVAAQRSRAEPLLIARSLFGRTMQLMDTEGTAVGVLEEPYVVGKFYGTFYLS